jgi:hypothetical protein
VPALLHVQVSTTHVDCIELVELVKRREGGRDVCYGRAEGEEDKEQVSMWRSSTDGMRRGTQAPSSSSSTTSALAVHRGSCRAGMSKQGHMAHSMEPTTMNLPLYPHALPTLVLYPMDQPDPSTRSPARRSRAASRIGSCTPGHMSCFIS